MGVEVLGSDFSQGEVCLDNVEPNQRLGLEEPIKFGLVDSLDGKDVLVVKGEEGPAKDTNFPKDAVDEWPEEKRIHSFYFVKYRSYEDPKLKAKIEQFEKELQKKNQERFQINEAIKAKKSDRAMVISQLKPLTHENKNFRSIVDSKRKEMEPLQVALGKLRGANNGSREKGVGLCSSEDELNDIINSLHYRIQHESNTLVEEKQLLREIKQFEGTREKVVANDAMKAKIQNSLGQREAIQDQVKLIGVDLDGVRKEQLAVRSKIKHLEDELKAIDNEISSLQEESESVNLKRDKVYQTLSELRKELNEGNACYYQNRSLLNSAKDLAAKKDIVALKELYHIEVEKFMSLWCGNKAVRDDYARRILPSLDSRQLSRDGRMRNPDEKPLAAEVSASTESEKMKRNIKRPDEDVTLAVQQETVSIQKDVKEEGNKLTEIKTKGNMGSHDDMEKFSRTEKSHKESSVANEIDVVKLKELKREEEMAKAKLALERKKKLAEKAAAKAAVRAQKEAEKKIKERERKAKKKAGASVPSSNAEQIGMDSETTDPEKTQDNEAPMSPKIKEQKGNVRHRSQPKGSDQPPKVILKRKKSSSYWLWAAPATLFVLVFAVLGYYYFL
eukprot:TRINITY_DN20461_c0_g1_i1.p1 TRINITY_DN20461_c0_g1~~TRINITY_DN20461_c0_g1_i1.p1  ORF type:complete len:616 (+),score=169.98 TRINITY_DN20461_c0_g1_i1:180-2027(+)